MTKDKAIVLEETEPGWGPTEYVLDGKQLSFVAALDYLTYVRQLSLRTAVDYLLVLWAT